MQILTAPKRHMWVVGIAPHITPFNRYSSCIQQKHFADGGLPTVDLGGANARIETPDRIPAAKIQNAHSHDRFKEAEQ